MYPKETELKKLLRENGITYRLLAATLGRNYQTISSWLNGYNRLPDNERRRIMKVIESKKLKNEQLEVSTERKIIQLETNNRTVYALCDDCTVWHIDGRLYKMPSIDSQEDINRVERKIAPTLDGVFALCNDKTFWVYIPESSSKIKNTL